MKLRTGELYEHYYTSIHTYRVEYVRLLLFLLKCGVTGDQVGVVTPYRHQQTKIKEALANLPLTQC